jgi:hypothetical protein
MTTPRRTACAVSGLTLIALTLVSGGCGSIFESNQAACRRATYELFTCGSPSVAPPEFAFVIAQICAPVPETSECSEWSAFADCLSSVSCPDPFTYAADAEEACGDILSRLQNNGCSP